MEQGKPEQFSTKRIKRSTTDNVSKMANASNQNPFEEIENNKSKNCAGILTDNGSTLNTINNELLDFRDDILTQSEHGPRSQQKTMQTRNKGHSSNSGSGKMSNQNHYRRSHSHKSKNRYTHHNNSNLKQQQFDVDSPAPPSSPSPLLSQKQSRDKLEHCQRKSTSSTSSTSSGNGGINVISNPLEAAVCTQPRTTIVVQQVSIDLIS